MACKVFWNSSFLWKLKYKFLPGFVNSAFSLDEDDHETLDASMDEEHPIDTDANKSEANQTENLISFFNRWDFVVGLIPPTIMFVEWLLCKFSLIIITPGSSITSFLAVSTGLWFPEWILKLCCLYFCWWKKFQILSIGETLAITEAVKHKALFHEKFICFALNWISANIYGFWICLVLPMRESFQYGKTSIFMNVSSLYLFNAFFNPPDALL